MASKRGRHEDEEEDEDDESGGGGDQEQEGKLRGVRGENRGRRDEDDIDEKDDEEVGDIGEWRRFMCARPPVASVRRDARGGAGGGGAAGGPVLTALTPAVCSIAFRAGANDGDEWRRCCVEDCGESALRGESACFAAVGVLYDDARGSGGGTDDAAIEAAQTAARLASMLDDSDGSTECIAADIAGEGGGLRGTDDEFLDELNLSVAAGAGLGLLWGGLARVCVSHHITWSINSICHIFGSQDYKSSDDSRNNVFFGFLSHGEGWHNNHHAYPDSARHGLRWFEFDITWMHIRLLRRLGLTRKVRQARYSG